MAEIAIISAKRSRLQKLASEGDEKAALVLALSKNPNRFLSTIQIGITLIGIFAGAFGGATLAEKLSVTLSTIPAIAPFSQPVALTIVVLFITYLSVVLGELVPKRLGLVNPDATARLVVTPVSILSRIFSPLVTVLSVSTDWFLGLFGIRVSEKPSISEEELKLLIKEGAKVGVFELAEKDIFERTLRVGNKNVSALMTPRNEIIWIDIDSSFSQIKKTILSELHSYFPVCKDNVDTILGVVATREVLAEFMKKGNVHISTHLRKPPIVPENMPALKVLELFKKTGVHVAIVIDEYANLQGLISLNNIMSAIVGDIPTIDEIEDHEITKRKDGTFLIDGLILLDELKEKLKIKAFPGEKNASFHTIGGFVMSRLGRVPKTGDKVEFDEYTVEVIDMDGNRVDKVLLSKKRLLA